MVSGPPLPEQPWGFCRFVVITSDWWSQSLGWGSEYGTKFLKQPQCGSCKRHTLSKLNRVLFFNLYEREITVLSGKLVTDLKVLKTISCSK